MATPLATPASWVPQFVSVAVAPVQQPGVSAVQLPSHLYPPSRKVQAVPNAAGASGKFSTDLLDMGDDLGVFAATV
jgi:hypothetical protein